MNDIITDFDIVTQWKEEISTMSREDMARLYRFAKAGHPVFDSTLPLYNIFKKRFAELGGFSPEISKKIGWGN